MQIGFQTVAGAGIRYAESGRPESADTPLRYVLSPAAVGAKEVPALSPTERRAGRYRIRADGGESGSQGARDSARPGDKRGGSDVGQWARRRRDADGDAALQAAVRVAS